MNNINNNAAIINTEKQIDSETNLEDAESNLELVEFSYLNPLTWLKSNDNSIEQVEKRMFKCVKSPVKRFYVNIRNNSLKIWTLSCNTESSNIPIVLIHGFCGGIGLWVHNIEALSSNRPVYAIDLLGFGRSSRPPFSSDPIVAETQFVESIEDWRKELGLQEFILLGHSFGGYISTSYSLKYPDYVKALILADPWGFPEHSEEEKPDTPIPLWISAIVHLSHYISPMTVFRMSGKVGVSVFKYLRPDFKKKFMTILDDPELVYSYLYHANNYQPSGEAGFRSISKYFGFAKNPMIRRIDKVKSHIPVWFIYGSRSWIDCTAGYSAIYLRQSINESTLMSVEIISGAGHHVYADKPKDFNEYVRYLLDEVGFELPASSDSDSPNSN